MIKRGKTFNLTGGEFTRYYNKMDEKPVKKAGDEKLVGVDFQLNGTYAKLDDGREFYYQESKKKWMPMPLDKKDKDKILNKLGKVSGVSERKQQSDNNAWLDSIKVDADLLNMVNIDASKLNGDYRFANMYKYFRTDFMSTLKNVLPQKYDIRDYRYFYRAAMWAKMGSILRRAPFNMTFPPKPTVQMAGGGFSGIGKAVGDVGSELEILPVLVPSGSASGGSGYPVPVMAVQINDNVDLENLIFRGIPVQGGERLSITEYVNRGGVLPVPIMTAIRAMNLTGKRLRESKPLNKAETELINQLNGELDRQAQQSELDPNVESKGEDRLITQGSTREQKYDDFINSRNLSNIVFNILDAVHMEHGMRQVDNSVAKRTNYSTIVKLMRMLNPDQNQRVLSILNSVGIQVSYLSDTDLTRDDLLNRAIVIMRNLPLGRQVDTVDRIRSILGELRDQKLSDAQRRFLDIRPIQSGEQLYRQFNPSDVINRMRELFIPAISHVYSAEEANDIFDDLQSDLEGIYTAEIYSLGGYSAENEIAAADQVLREFIKMLAQYSVDMRPIINEFNPQAFATFLNNLFQQIKNRPQFSFSKLIEHLNSGELKARLTSLYNSVINGELEPQQDDNLNNRDRMFSIDLNPNQAFIDEVKQGASVLNTREDIRDLVRSITDYGRDRMSRLVFSVRNFRMYNADIAQAHEAAFGMEGENKNVERDNYILFEIDEPDFLQEGAADAYPRPRTIKRFMSLRNLAYLMSLLGFAGGVITGIVEALKNATPSSPPETFPPLPNQPPVNPPVTPDGPVPARPPINPPVNPPGPPVGPVNPPVGPITPVPAGPTDTPTVVIPGQPGQPGEKDSGVMTNPDWGEGTQRQYFKDPNELELISMTKLQQEKDFRNFTEFSLFQPNNGLGNARTNPLIRENIKDDMRRFKNNFEYARPLNMQLLTKERQIKQTYSGKGCMNFTMPVIQCDFGRVHFEDENVGIKMSNTPFQPDYETQFNQQMYLKNGMYNPDRGLYHKGVSAVNYKPVKIGESSRNSKHFGLSKEYRQDELSQKSFNINNQDSQINDYGKQIPFGFNFGNTTQQDFPTEQLLKTNLYSGLRYNIALKKK